jgi:hypothetical protein
MSVLLITIFVAHAPAAHAAFGDIFEGAKKILGLDTGLSTDTIVRGLKEALQIGTGNAVETVSKLGGYSGNPRIKIPLPDSVRKAETILRTVGFGSKLDEFELSMNKAAEQAAPEAKSIFWDAIKQMSFPDARKILEGRDNEATLYFKDKTHGRLYEVFKPVVKQAMSRVGVTRRYQELDDKLGSMPFTEKLGLDLDDYVTNGALKGLFHMVAEEEKKIRQNPAARVTDLLKEVFGNR